MDRHLGGKQNVSVSLHLLSATKTPWFQRWDLALTLLSWRTPFSLAFGFISLAQVVAHELQESVH